MSLRRKATLAYPALADTYRYTKAVSRTLLRWATGQKALHPEGYKTIHVDGYRNSFCGYYDHSPFQPGNDDLLIVHATNVNAWQRPNPNEPLDIWLLERESGRAVQQLGQTFAWNWQQGARAHWLDSNTYIYNTFDLATQDYRAVVGGLGGQKTEVLPLPVQESDSKGGVYSINFAALARYRPDYGYRNRPCTEADIRENRIQRYSTSSGDTRDFVGVEDLVRWTEHEDGHPLQMYKINHLLAAPSGEKLVFLFRYFVGHQRVTDLFCLNVTTGEWDRLLHNAAVSHFCWLDDRRVILTGNTGDGYGYYQIDVVSKTMELLFYRTDGHPCLLPDGQIVSDTYPDRYRMRTLYGFSLASPAQHKTIGRVIEPFGFHGEMRCDLHPSPSPSGEWLQVDTATGHRRCIGIVPLNGLLEK